MSDHKKYNQIFDYLSAPSVPTEAKGNFVFGRADPLLAKKMAQMHATDLADYFLVTGGIGKDSGELAKTGTPEATFIGGLAVKEGVPSSKIYLETEATNGGENVRNGIVVIQANRLSLRGLTVVAHATSLRRLTETIRHENVANPAVIGEVSRIPTDYAFDPKNENDQAEARAELLRLADWPTRQPEAWLQPQEDLPLDLVDFARHQQPTV